VAVGRAITDITDRTAGSLTVRMYLGATAPGGDGTPAPTL